LIVIANEIPLINLFPNDSFDGIIPTEYRTLLVNTAHDVDSVTSLVDNTLLPDTKEVTNLLGFYPNAAKNIVDFWVNR
jgi:hypothetical protein